MKIMISTMQKPTATRLGFFMMCDIPERYLCVGLCLWRFDILYMYANFYVGGDDTVRIGVERVPRTYNRRKISYKCSGVERRRIIY